MILQWFEHWTYSYQKYTLPIKLKNLNNKLFVVKLILKTTIKSTQTWTENMKFEASHFTIKLYSQSEKRWIEHLNVKIHGILADTLPYQ